MQPMMDAIGKFLSQEVLSSLANATKAPDILKADHRKVELLFTQFEKTSGKEKQIILDAILKELSIHATVEEELVYPIIADEDNDMAEEAEEEHHVVKLLLGELASIPANSESAKPKVKVLSELVMNHVKEEEHEIFPVLVRSGEDMQALGQRIKARKVELGNQLNKPTIREVGKSPVDRSNKRANTKTSSANGGRRASKTTISQTRKNPARTAKTTSASVPKNGSSRSSRSKKHTKETQSRTSLRRGAKSR